MKITMKEMNQKRQLRYNERFLLDRRAACLPSTQVSERIRNLWHDLEIGEEEENRYASIPAN